MNAAVSRDPSRCEHGACGACTALLDGAAVRSCLIFAVQAEDMEVTRVEGVASMDGELSPVPSRSAAGLSWTAMQLLHNGFRHADHRADERQSASQRYGDTAGLVRQLLSLHGLPGHHQRRARAAGRT